MCLSVRLNSPFLFEFGVDFPSNVFLFVLLYCCVCDNERECGKTGIWKIMKIFVVVFYVAQPHPITHSVRLSVCLLVGWLVGPPKSKICSKSIEAL